MRVTEEAILPAPAETAWQILGAWEEQARWMKDADSVRVLSANRQGPGVRIAVVTRVLNVPAFTEKLEVIEWDPPHRLLMAHRSFVRGVGEWSLEPAAGGCRFRWIEDISLPVPFLGEIALLAYRPFMRRLMRGALANLRRYVGEREET